MDEAGDGIRHGDRANPESILRGIATRSGRRHAIARTASEEEFGKKNKKKEKKK
jgi:hypothetical protein